MSPLEISEVQILPIKPRDGLVAFASCVVNGQLYLGNIAVHTRLDGSGYRLVFPIKVLPNGKEIQCVHPITHEAGDALQKAVIGKLEVLASGAVRKDDVLPKQRRGEQLNETYPPSP